MRTSIPCPKCQETLTVEHFEDFSTPFTMKCPHCHAKLKETKMTPFLLLIAAVMVPLLILLGISVQNLLVDYFPVVESIPTALVFIAFCYPVYALYERFNATVLFNKGNLQLKNRQ